MDPLPALTSSSVMTVDECCQRIQLLLESANLHYGHGASNAQAEALWIVSKQLGQSPSETLEHLELAISGELSQKALEIAKKRIESRQPLAYLLGEAWLMGVPFDCTPQSIIPRSFIAELIVNESLESWLPADGKVLDLCTGNGSLAVLMALCYPDLQVVASDLSLPALALAARNLDRHQLSDRIELLHGDLWEPIAQQDLRFDLIICNPPYVNEQSMQVLPEEYHAEPREALAGGSDGMDLIRWIIHSAGEYLHERGALVLEIGNEYDHFQKAFGHLSPIWMEVSAGDRQVCLIEAEDLRR
jgi:ribosomal protein L3 glutamine methyltransferase